MSQIKIQEIVANKLANAGSTVQDIIVEELTNKAIAERVELVKKGMSKLEGLEKEFKKVNQPDIRTFSGNPTGEDQPQKSATYSEQRWNDIQKQKKAIETLEATLIEALEKNTEEAYKKLGELTK